MPQTLPLPIKELLERRHPNFLLTDHTLEACCARLESVLATLSGDVGFAATTQRDANGVTVTLTWTGAAGGTFTAEAQSRELALLRATMKAMTDSDYRGAFKA
jgi:hypothetical protein